MARCGDVIRIRLTTVPPPHPPPPPGGGVARNSRGFAAPPPSTLRRVPLRFGRAYRFRLVIQLVSIK